MSFNVTSSQGTAAAFKIAISKAFLKHTWKDMPLSIQIRPNIMQF